MRPSSDDRAGRENIQIARRGAQLAVSHILGTSGGGGRRTGGGGGGLPPPTTTASGTNTDVHPFIWGVDNWGDADALWTAG